MRNVVQIQLAVQIGRRDNILQLWLIQVLLRGLEGLGDHRRLMTWVYNHVHLRLLPRLADNSLELG